MFTLLGIGSYHSYRSCGYVLALEVFDKSEGEGITGRDGERDIEIMRRERQQL